MPVAAQPKHSIQTWLMLLRLRREN
jgi:hypothetical protein